MRRNRFELCVGPRARARDNQCMQHADDCTDYTLQMLVLERGDESCNMARYYVLSVEPTLFGDFALVRQWGRIGSPGRRRLDLHADDEAAGEALEHGSPARSVEAIRSAS